MATYEKTDKPGVYLRGSTYYCAVTSGGKTKKIAAGKTLSAAVKLKRKLESERDRGHDPFGRRENERFADYARACIAGYSGRGSHRIGERTRLEYARDMENHVLPWMGQTRLGRVSRKTIRDLVAHLQGDDCNLADASVRRVMAPVKACLATAYEDGDLAANPAQGVRILATPRPVGETRAKALTREQWVGAVDRKDRPALAVADPAARLDRPPDQRSPRAHVGRRRPRQPAERHGVEGGQARRAGTDRGAEVQEQQPHGAAVDLAGDGATSAPSGERVGALRGLGVRPPTRARCRPTRTCATAC